MLVYSTGTEVKPHDIFIDRELSHYILCYVEEIREEEIVIRRNTSVNKLVISYDNVGFVEKCGKASQFKHFYLLSRKEDWEKTWRDLLDKERDIILPNLPDNILNVWKEL